MSPLQPDKKIDKKIWGGGQKTNKNYWIPKAYEVGFVTLAAHGKMSKIQGRNEIW